MHVSECILYSHQNVTEPKTEAHFPSIPNSAVPAAAVTNPVQPGKQRRKKNVIFLPHLPLHILSQQIFSFPFSFIYFSTQILALLQGQIRGKLKVRWCQEPGSMEQARVTLFDGGLGHRRERQGYTLQALHGTMRTLRTASIRQGQIYVADS